MNECNWRNVEFIGVKLPSSEDYKGPFSFVGWLLERFSNDCRKTKTKAITPSNHNRSRQRDEPITIPSN